MVNSSANYWIAANALSISLNALGDANRIQCGLATGSVIMCYIKGVEGLEYDNGHNYRRWPLTISPTYFNTYTHKYVYVAIPRNASVGNVAMVVFPSQKIDIYGYVVLDNGESSNERIGNDNYYYIWLQGIISDSGQQGVAYRQWVQVCESGTLSTDEATSSEETPWYSFDQITQTVTFLKEIFMGANSIFNNLKARILTLAGHTLTGVAIDNTTDEDSTTDIATPAYIKSVSNDRYLRKDQDDATPHNLGIGKNLTVGGDTNIGGNASISGTAAIGSDLSVGGTETVNEIRSSNYTGDGVADTGFILTNNYRGKSRLVVDYIYDRMKLVAEALEIKETLFSAGDQAFSMAGNEVARTDYLDANGNTLGYSNVTVPWLVRKMPFLLNSSFYGRKRWIRISLDASQMGSIRSVRCYFLAEDGEKKVHNLWRVGDLARCQTFNLSQTKRETYTTVEEKQGNVFWWRKVVNVSDNQSTVEIDGKKYHYFDVAYDKAREDAGTFDMAAPLSDLPCAADKAVQWGNTDDPDRMNLMTLELNGLMNQDSPCIKIYRGIYTFDMNKCWWGGAPRKMLLSPSTGFEFYGPSFKFVQEYGIARVPRDRSEIYWSNIVTKRDDYAPHAMVRKCEYYDRISHQGSLWLCSVAEGAHWVRPQVWDNSSYALFDNDGNYKHNGDYIADADYAALSSDKKAQCGRVGNYTTEEPGLTAQYWTRQVSKGNEGDTPMQAFQWNNSATVAPSPLPSGAILGNWSLTAPNRPQTAGDHYLWMTQTLKHTDADGNETYELWSAAVRISGDKGDAGEDSSDREWIYKRLDDYPFPSTE